MAPRRRSSTSNPRNGDRRPSDTVSVSDHSDSDSDFVLDHSSSSSDAEQLPPPVPAHSSSSSNAEQLPPPVLAHSSPSSSSYSSSFVSSSSSSSSDAEQLPPPVLAHSEQLPPPVLAHSSPSSSSYSSSFVSSSSSSSDAEQLPPPVLAHSEQLPPPVLAHSSSPSSSSSFVSSSSTDSDSYHDYIVDTSIDDNEDGDLFPPPPVPAAAPPKKNLPPSSKKGSDPGLKWKIWEKENNQWLNNFEAHPAVADNNDDAPLAATADPSPNVLLPLLRFQKEFLAWALNQEASPVCGGILADEMGMGKTIQAISLILTARSRHPPPAAADVPSSSSDLFLPRTRCTLVVCPVVAMIQWAGEIERHTRKGSVRVLMYHGPKRGNVDYDFDDYDVVLTTYSTIENDYRKHIMPPKEKCQWCGKMLYPKKMQVHLKYYCGPAAQMTEKQSKQVRKRKRKVVSEDEKGKVKTGWGKGKEVQRKPTKRNLDRDVPDCNPVGQSPGKSVLHSVEWERIILDEAHFIKDRRCNTARAVFTLQSSYKWALSGTPLQNRVGELYSLVRFLQISPYSYYHCKDCDCKVLDYNSTRYCTDCPHATVRHFCWWNRYITEPMQTGQGFYGSRRAMLLLKTRLLKSIVLRRTKKGRAADLALPPRIVTLRRDSLDRNEQEFYEALYTQSRVQFDTYVLANTLMNNYAHIFDLLTRLRQAVDHPYLVVYSNTAGTPKSSKDDSAKDDCVICHDPAEDMLVTSCGHVFYKACMLDYSASLGNLSCPTCSKPLTVDFTTKNNNSEMICKTSVKGYKHSGILNRLRITDFKTSTKIDALREEIRDMVESDGSAKGLVFSQFTSFLDLISFSLQRSGVKCVQLVGSMSLAEREKAIKTFTDDADCRIFLMSLKAGGVALNLTVASHVFLMDPWWNPAVERQAQDRIHRIGQYKPIRVVRFVIENTIEERILKLQAKKELVFEGTVGESPEAMAKLTEADLKFLFHI